jgi:hypothetical protein
VPSYTILKRPSLNITHHLKKLPQTGDRLRRRIVFVGEVFDAASLRRLRDKAISAVSWLRRNSSTGSTANSRVALYPVRLRPSARRQVLPGWAFHRDLKAPTKA